jgi:hypothetical protein
MPGISALDIAEYPDSLYARYFDQTFKMNSNITQELMNDTMQFYADYYSLTLAGNETMRKLFITGMMNELMNQFEQRL